MTRKKSSAYLRQISAMLIFGTVGVFRRSIPLSSGLLSCVRAVLGVLVILVYLLLSRRKLSHGIGLRNVIRLLLIGAMLSANWLLLFDAFNYTSVSIASLCNYMAPTFVVILSGLLLGEKLTGKKAACSLAAIAGMVLVSGVLEGTSGGSDNLRGILLGLGAAVFYAAVVVLNKLTPTGDDYERTVLHLTGAALFMLPVLLFTEDFSALGSAGTQLLPVLILGVVHTGIAYVLYFGSMKDLPAQSVAILSYIDPVTSLLLSALLLNERLTPLGLLGAVLILGSAFLSER